MGKSILVELLIILILIAANGFFAGAEISVVAVRRTRIEELVELGRGGARVLRKLRDNPEQFLATVQIGITVVAAAAAAFGGVALSSRLEPLLARLGWVAPYAGDIALGLVVAFVSFLSIVLGELVPKSLALRHAERFALVVSRPLAGLSHVTRPMVWILTAISNVILKPFGDRTSFTETRHTTEELQQIVEEAVEAGTVHEQAGEIASRALDLPELTAMDVMVPRPDVVMVSRSASLEELRQTLLEHRHTRMPVYEGEIDNIIGYLTVKDLLSLSLERRPIEVSAILRPAHFVPETQRALDLLRNMRKEHLPFAIVVDEQGGFSGLVTVGDLLEELVGEIVSEHVRQIPLRISREPGGAALVSAALPVRDVNRELGIELPDDERWATLAGLCLAVAGRIPKTGEVLSLPDGYTLEVVDASARRVRTLRIRPPRGPSAQEEASV